MGSIITLRIIMIISAQITSAIGGYYTIWPCAKLAWILDDDRSGFRTRYPSCLTEPDRPTIVLADFRGETEQIGSALGLNFGMSGYLALFLHAVGVEIYVSSAPTLPCYPF